MMFITVLCGLALAAIFIFHKAKKTVPYPQNVHFENLQRNYLIAYFLATFSDWLQGPYVYKVYSDYGYEEEEIAILYVAGFASSFVFGVVVGHLADKYGRKLLCVLFGITYSLCCLTKMSSRFHILFIGRLLGGISTSILFSTFEAWYINEHINHHHLPPEWLNITFSKASFYTGFLAILAGIISQIFVETLNFGPATPFMLAIPFLLISTYFIYTRWTEHFIPNNVRQHRFLAPLSLIFFKDPLLFLLGLMQSLFEAVMYTFIFSWTPLLSELNPPLGIVFACFMLAFMIGSKLYTLLLSGNICPQFILVFIIGLALVAFSSITVVIMYISHSTVPVTLSTDTKTLLVHICFVSFILYEVSLGMYFPAISYFRGRVIPEEYRASISNWFRVPMNILTCVCLTLNQLSKDKSESVPETNIVFSKFYLIYILCSVFLSVTTLAVVIFKQKYTKRYCREESFSESNDSVKEVKAQSNVTIVKHNTSY